MIPRLGIALALVAVALAGCTDGFEGDSVAVICTNFGPITVELFDETPVTSQNFLDLADAGDFDGVPFHRIISGFMMQGGDVTNGDGTGGKTASGDKLPDETSPSLKHDKAGILSMANRGSDPTTGSSQFFITFKETPWLDGKHTVFGHVIDGMDVVERVEEEAASSSGSPRADVEMITVLPGTTDVGSCPAAQPLEPANVAVGTITGGFDVTNTQDRILVWAQNLGPKGSLTWDLTGIPEGWTASFTNAPDTVAKDKTAHTILELTVPEGTSGSFDATLMVGASSQPLTIDVALDGERVTGPGDHVDLEYRGSCTDGGKEFDTGAFDTTLGSGRTVPGFDYGLMGLALNEEATLLLPADLGYGPSGGPTGCSNGELTFEVSILAFR